jgi:hypothetical protein
MIRVIKLLICDEEHGADVCFPYDANTAAEDMRQYGSIGPLTAQEIRRAAHKVGWRHKTGQDLCPRCAGTETDE